MGKYIDLSINKTEVFEQLTAEDAVEYISSEQLLDKMDDSVIIEYLETRGYKMVNEE